MKPIEKKKEVFKAIRVRKEIMDLYSIVLRELEREFSEDVRLLIKMRIVSSQKVSLEDKSKILAEIEKEFKK